MKSKKSVPRHIKDISVRSNDSDLAPTIAIIVNSMAPFSSMVSVGTETMVAADRLSCTAAVIDIQTCHSVARHTGNMLIYI